MRRRYTLADLVAIFLLGISVMIGFGRWWFKGFFKDIGKYGKKEI